MIKPVKGMPEMLRPNPPPRTAHATASEQHALPNSETRKLQAPRVPLPTTQVENNTIGRFINTYA